MGSFRNVQPSDTLEIPLLNTVAVRNIRPIRQVPKGPTPFKLPEPLDALYVLLPLFAFFLWAISLQHVSAYAMNGLGLISVLSPSIIVALVILTISFGLALQQSQMKVSILALHLILVIIMLYGTQNVIEEAPRFATVYRHAGYAEYIMRTGTVDPDLDTYFSWPGFFVLSAFVTQVAGFQSVLSYAEWAPVFYNLIYIGPMYMIFTSSTTNKRLVWLGLWFFYLNNWIGQDYFSPQGLNFFLYLVIIAILLKWFKIPPKAQPQVQRHRWQSRVRFPQLVSRFIDWLGTPDPFFIALQPWQHRALLASLLLVYGLVVFSHPLTPFFVLPGVAALMILRRCRPFWLPIVMVIMTAAWILIMAQPFLVGHLNLVIGSFGDVSSNISSNVTSRATQGNQQHLFIALLRIIMSVFIWGLAFLGGMRRLSKGYKGTTYVLLAVAPFALIVAQNYGGEMSLRIFLFALPLMAFFAASLFYSKHTLVIRKTSTWMTLAIIATNLVMLGGFFFTRYGNEGVDYITYAEFDGVQHLYSIAPPHSLLIEAWNDSPWQYKDYEKFTCEPLGDEIPDAVINANVGEVVRFIESQGNPHTYLLFTRGQKANGTIYDGLPDDTLDRLENVLLASRDFKLIYRNPDAQILLFLGSKKGGRS